MEQIEVMSWQTLDALKESATKTIEIISDLDTDDHMSIFMKIDEDYLEIYYSEVDSNYIRRFDDEDEMYRFIEERKNELGEDKFDTIDYYNENEDDFSGEGSSGNLEGFSIRSDDSEEEF
jgi:hypothetical protein